MESGIQIQRTSTPMVCTLVARNHRTIYL
uniref:Uncharacterized protein n=1 Tax=Ciona savignyi TaxID=51511 RepID=H2YJ37_CIOSA